MLIPMKELNDMTANIEGIRTSIYFLNEYYLVKRFNRLNSREKWDKEARYNLSREFNDLENISLPCDILETEKGFCGYIEKVIPDYFSGNLGHFGDYVNDNKYFLTLEEITDYILKVANIIEKCHKHEIVVPDLASDGNVQFNKETKEVWLLDYQDMQVKNIKTSYHSSFIENDPIINFDKYYHDGLWTTNIDLYTLAIRYFYYATKINMPNASLTGHKPEEYLALVGISDTYFAECLRRLYDLNQDNLDIRDAIIELNQKYTISPFVPGQARKFIKK